MRSNFSPEFGLRRFILVALTGIVFFVPSLIYAQSYFTNPSQWNVDQPAFTKDQKNNWSLEAAMHERLSFNHVSNTVDLNSHNNNDETSYLGVAYDFTFDIKHISGFETHFFVERRGRADYDAPVTGNRQIHTLFGTYQWYHNTDLTPRLREYYVKVPLTPAQEINDKFGLFPYGRQVGHGIALGGKYENYGNTLTGSSELFDWNLHWEKEDLNNRIHLGKVIDQEKAVAHWHDTSAYFSAGDTTLKLGDHRWQFYMGWLHDGTKPSSRASLYAGSVRKDDLITPGQYLQLKFNKLNLGFETARNFGKAKGNNGSSTIFHQGYLLVADASYDLGSFKPKAKLIIASGNKFNESNFNSLTLTGNKNKAFSVFSPLNTNLTSSHYQKQYGPYVFMAGGYAVNFGIARPGTFSDPFLFENLIAPTVGFDYTPFEKVYIGMDYWYLRAKEPGYGLDQNGKVRSFPQDLGQEIDLFTSYQLTPKIKISLLTGYFFPGRYYQQKRTDTAANNTFAPTPRRDGKANGAYQIELAFDFTF